MSAASAARSGRRRRRARLGAALAAAAWLAGASGATLAQPGLLEVYRTALTQDPEYLAAGAANRAAQEARPQAVASLLPQLDATASATGTEQDIRESSLSLFTGGARRENFNVTQFELSLTQPVYRKDLWIGVAQADLNVRRADLDFAFARQSLMLRVAERYFALLRAVDQLSFARATLEAFGQQLEQSRQRYEVGLIAITDVEEAKAGFDRAKADVIAAENQLDVAREALREVAGRYYADVAGLRADTPLVTPEPSNIDRWTETALAQNLQLASARVLADVAREEIRRTRAQHLPTLDLVAKHQRRKIGGGLSGRSRVWESSIGLQVRVPIYQGGLVTSRTRQSVELHQQALDEVERARRSAQRLTREAYLGVESGISRVEALNQAVRSAQSAKEAIDAGFQVGTRTSVDVLDADRDVFRAQRDLAFARYDYILDVLRLKLAAGTLSDDDLVLVDGWLSH